MPVVKTKSKVKIIKRINEPETGKPLPLEVQPSRQSIDLSKRSMEEQIELLKSPFYSAHARTQREMDKLIESMLGMLVAKDNRTLQLTEENKKMAAELENLRPKSEKSKPKTENKSNPKPKKK